MSYTSDVYDAAVIAGWTPEEVEQATYTQIANTAGVTLGPNDSSPADFHYAAIKRRVAQKLRDVAAQEKFDSAKVTIEAKLRELTRFATADITIKKHRDEIRIRVEDID